MIRRATCLAATLTLILASSSPAVAQTGDLSGTWRLDRSRSQLDDEAGLAGLIAVGVPETLHVTHPANGSLVVESQVNESHARLYVPGVETETPVFLGAAGSVRMTSRWEGSTLVSEGTREMSAGDAAPIAVRETYALGSDGRALVVTIHAKAAGRQAESRLSYARIDSVGTCDSWPSPCKAP